jgi:hypothetical protein
MLVIHPLLVAAIRFIAARKRSGERLQFRTEIE